MMNVNSSPSPISSRAPSPSFNAPSIIGDIASNILSDKKNNEYLSNSGYSKSFKLSDEIDLKMANLEMGIDAEDIQVLESLLNHINQSIRMIVIEKIKSDFLKSIENIIDLLNRQSLTKMLEVANVHTETPPLDSPEIKEIFDFLKMLINQEGSFLSYALLAYTLDKIKRESIDIDASKLSLKECCIYSIRETEADYNFSEPLISELMGRVYALLGARLQKGEIIIFSNGQQLDAITCFIKAIGLDPLDISYFNQLVHAFEERELEVYCADGIYLDKNVIKQLMLTYSDKI